MMKKIDARSVGKDEMTRYIKQRENYQKIKTASKLKEYLETIELMLIEDFDDFKRGCDNQFKEMSDDEVTDRRSSSSSSPNSPSSPSSSSKSYTKRVSWSETMQSKYNLQ